MRTRRFQAAGQVYHKILGSSTLIDWLCYSFIVMKRNLALLNYTPLLSVQE